MSWQAYIDSTLLGSGKVNQAIIIGHDGAPWAKSSGFNISATEANALVAAFKDPSGIRANGLYINGIRFIALRADDRSIYAKKDTTGICCVKTNRAIIIGYYTEAAQAGQANDCVEKLGDYLRGLNY